MNSSASLASRLARRQAIAALLACGLLADAALAQTPLAPASVPRIESAPPATQPRVVDPEQPRADGIADRSHHAREAAQRLKQENVAPVDAFRAIRSAFQPSDRDNYQALLAAGYLKPDLVRALQNISQLNADGFARKLDEVGEDPGARAIFLRSVFNLEFDELLEVLHRSGGRNQNNFLPALRAMKFSLDQIIQAGYRYYNGRLLTGADGRPYPGPAALQVIVRSLQPAAQYFDLWARLIRVGYPRNVLFSELTLGESSPQGGNPLDNVAGCMAQRFGRPIEGVNPKIDLTIRADGSVAHDAGQRDCYVRFAAQLRTQGIERSATAGIVAQGVACAPRGNPRCDAETLALVETLLKAAAYPAEPR